MAMYYTIGEVAKIMNVAPSTLRYYDKEGLLPFVERSNGGMRMFKKQDFEQLFIIDCLKKTGVSIKDIKTFMGWVVKGDTAIDERLELFQKRREIIKEQIKQLEQTLSVLDYKCWYYETAKNAGTTTVPRSMELEDIPQDLQPIRRMFDEMREHPQSAYK